MANHTHKEILICQTQIEYDNAKSWVRARYDTGKAQAGMFSYEFDDANKTVTLTTTSVLELSNDVWVEV